VWKHIRRGLRVFSSLVRYEVGDGTKIRFWHDLWCGDQTLKESFQELFSIVCCVSRHGLRLICRFLMVIFSKTYILLNLYRIERSIC
jgi:hypothetical protein